MARELKAGDRFSAMDIIQLLHKCRRENRLTESEILMFSSMIAQYLHLETMIEEYKFKLKEK